MRVLALLMMVCLSAADEHWFAFDQYQFPGFYTPLFTLISSSKTKTNRDEQKNLSFALSTYERSISVDISIGNANGTSKHHEQTIKLNIERADLLYNTFNHLIFIALRQRTKLETYVNCKLIDSYLLYSSNPRDTYDANEKDVTLTMEKAVEGVTHLHSSTDEHYQQHVFDKFGCKHTEISPMVYNKTTTTIGRPLIRKMQHVIEKVQRRRQRSRRQQYQQASAGLTSDSMTIIYKPSIGPLDDDESVFATILNVPHMALQVRYYPHEHLFHIRFNNGNRTQFILYADKATDLIGSSNASTSKTVLFLHITPTLISCYVNCELTDQEFVIDSNYVQNIIRQTMERNAHDERDAEKQAVAYHRQSTLLLFNQSIEQVAANFFCLRLDKKNEELLPDKYALRKFANALDMLVNSLDTPINYNHPADPMYATTVPPPTTTPNIAVVHIPSINGFGSLIAPPSNTEGSSTNSEVIDYDRSCVSDQDCASSNTAMRCQQSHCICPPRYFWSPVVRRCLACKDLSVGNRCFRLSSHKSTWYETNDFCQDEASTDEQQEYTMKLASNLNRTDIELLKRSLLQEEEGEQLDYYYWIGLTSQFDTRKLHQQPGRNKRRVPTTIFRWYDNGETAQLNMADIWCSQTDQSGLGATNNNELCVSLTSCGLYADDCQRNYRFLCEAV